MYVLCILFTNFSDLVPSDNQGVVLSYPRNNLLLLCLPWVGEVALFFSAAIFADQSDISTHRN